MNIRRIDPISVLAFLFVIAAGSALIAWAVTDIPAYSFAALACSITSLILSGMRSEP